MIVKKDCIVNTKRSTLGKKVATKLMYPLIIACLLSFFVFMSGVLAIALYSNDIFKDFNTITPTQGTIIILTP